MTVNTFWTIEGYDNRFSTHVQARDWAKSMEMVSPKFVCWIYESPGLAE